MKIKFHPGFHFNLNQSFEFRINIKDLYLTAYEIVNINSELYHI